MTQAVRSALGASRDRVLRLLRGADEPMTIPEIVELTGLSANTVRFHLDHLVGLGSVQPVHLPAPRRPGRPAKRYTALPEEAVDPASAYRVLAGLLGRELASVGGPDAAAAAGRAWAGRIFARGREWSPEPELAGRDGVDLVVDMFAATGFRPTVDDDGRTVRLHRCPFRELAAEQPDMVCGVHRGLVVGILEQTGSRATVDLTPVLDGSGPCVLRLGDPDAPAAHSPHTSSTHHTG